MGTDRRPRRILLVGTFLVFFLPILAAWLLNIFAPDWRPFGTLNHGTLVQPVRQLSAGRLEHVDGSPLDSGYLAGRWTIVHLLDGDCRQSCMQALTRSHQVQQALGDDMQRVQLLLVVQPAVAVAAARMPPAVTLATADGDWLEELSLARAPAGHTLRIYLVDPQGYLMMRYDQDVDQRGLLADLERLLKISKIG